MNNGPTTWKQRDERFLLRAALHAFCLWKQGVPSTNTTREQEDDEERLLWTTVVGSGITTLQDLVMATYQEDPGSNGNLKHQKTNEDFGASKGNYSIDVVVDDSNNQEVTPSSWRNASAMSDAATTIRLGRLQQQQLRDFLPGPTALNCLNLAKRAVRYAELNPACIRHVHRSSIIPAMSTANTNKINNCLNAGGERWIVSTTDTGGGNSNDDWTMHVDCAGFVRNVLGTILERPFVPALSDRWFMRSKDFVTFLESIPSLSFSVAGKDTVTSSGSEIITSTSSTSLSSLNNHGNDSHDSSYGRWRRVDDLRMIVAGDLIAYRHKGEAAGGAAFLQITTLSNLLKAVVVKFVYEQASNQ